MSKSSSHRRNAVSTVLVMSGTLLSRILGFVRSATVGALFGAGGQADVINLVFNIPNNLRKLLAEGALSTAFIPELSRQITEDSTGKQSQRLAGSIMGLQIIIILPLLAISMLFPHKIIGIFQNFQDPVKRELSALLFRWMIPYLLFISASAVMMAVHNTHNHFGIPAFTPVVFSICVILSLLFGYARWEAVAMGFGVLLGGLAQILVQYPGFRSLGYTLVPNFNFQTPGFRRIIRQWIPILLASSLFAVNNQVAMLLASILPDKSASSLAYAIVFYQLPFGLFSASIATVLYPAMSRQAAAKDFDGLVTSLGFGCRNLWALLVPSAVLLSILGEPIVAAAFQRGAFTRLDTVLTAQVLTAYCVGMPFVGLYNIAQRTFYAIGNTKKPIICALIVAGMDIILSLVFIYFLNGGSRSLAWANSLAFAFGAILQFLLLHKELSFSFSKRNIIDSGKVILAAAIGFVIAFASLKLDGGGWWIDGSSWRSFAFVMAAGLLSAGAVFLFYWWSKVETVSIFFRKNKH